MVIFDCNGVLVDSEPLATAIVSQEFVRADFPLTPDMIARYFTGRRPADMFAEVEFATGRKLPVGFAATVAAAILRRFRGELRPTNHAAYALSWLRGPKCVASSSSLERIRVSLESTGLIRFFEPNLFSASDVRKGKPAPDLFLHTAGKLCVEPGACIVVEDSPVGVAAGVAAGMMVICRCKPHRQPDRRSTSRRRCPRDYLRPARPQKHDHRSARLVEPAQL